MGNLILTQTSIWSSAKGWTQLGHRGKKGLIATDKLSESTAETVTQNSDLEGCVQFQEAEKEEFINSCSNILKLRVSFYTQWSRITVILGISYLPASVVASFAGGCRR